MEAVPDGEAEAGPLVEDVSRVALLGTGPLVATELKLSLGC